MLALEVSSVLVLTSTRELLEWIASEVLLLLEVLATRCYVVRVVAYSNGSAALCVGANFVPRAMAARGLACTGAQFASDARHQPGNVFGWLTFGA